MNEKISVIIPVYNVEAYLERCLKSLTGNTYRNLEIICVNDGSTDGSGEILDRLAQQDERIVVIHKENGGASSARNRGLDAATGEFIAFVDSDDWVHPQYFEIMLQSQKEQNYDLVFCGFSKVCKETTADLYTVDEIKTVAMNLADAYRTSARYEVWGKLYRRDMVHTVRFEETLKTAEDLAFNTLVLGRKADVHIGCVQSVLYFYYERQGSLVSRHNMESEWAFFRTALGYVKKIQENNSKYVLLRDLLKRYLPMRYEYSLYPGERKRVKEYDRMIRVATQALCDFPNIPLKEKAMYVLLGTYPGFYRIALVAKNPGMLAWEKEQKRVHKKKIDKLQNEKGKEKP